MGQIAKTYVGKPCAHGHSGVRYLNRSCIECASLQSTARRLANPQKHVQTVRNWQARNPDKAKEYERRAARTIHGRYKCLLTNARTRSIEVRITQEEFAEIISAPCFYCGGLLPEAGSGVDRIDSQIGYVIGNCRPCCYICNLAKSDLTETEFKSWVERIYSHYVRQDK